MHLASQLIPVVCFETGETSSRTQEYMVCGLSLMLTAVLQIVS